MKSCHLLRPSRPLLKIPIAHGLAAVLLVGIAVIGHGPALARAASPSHLTLRLSEVGVLVGTYGLVNSSSPFIATAQDTLSGEGTAFDNLTQTGFGPFANGCLAQQIQGAFTFKNPADSLSYISIGTACPIAGHPTAYKYANRLLVISSTGKYAGYSGSGTATGTSSPTVGTPPPNKPVTLPYTGVMTLKLQGK